MSLTFSPKVIIFYYTYIRPYLKCFTCCYPTNEFNDEEERIPMYPLSSTTIKEMIDKSNQTDDIENFDWDVI